MWHQNNFPFGSLSKQVHLYFSIGVGEGGDTIKSPFDPKDDVTILNSTPQQINASKINL